MDPESLKDSLGNQGYNKYLLACDSIKKWAYQLAYKTNRTITFEKVLLCSDPFGIDEVLLRNHYRGLYERLMEDLEKDGHVSYSQKGALKIYRGIKVAIPPPPVRWIATSHVERDKQSIIIPPVDYRNSGVLPGGVCNPPLPIEWVAPGQVGREKVPLVCMPAPPFRWVAPSGLMETRFQSISQAATLNWTALGYISEEAFASGCVELKMQVANLLHSLSEGDKIMIMATVVKFRLPGVEWPINRQRYATYMLKRMKHMIQMGFFKQERTSKRYFQAKVYVRTKKPITGYVRNLMS